MIVTLTANPSLDRTVLLDAPLAPGEVQAAASAREDPGGKGINVSRVVHAAGVPTVAVLPLADDDPFDAALRAARLPSRRVPVAGHARANVTITDPGGVTTKLNLPGATLTTAEATAVIDAVVDATRGARWLALAGSLPPGVGERFYVDVIAAVRAAHGADAPRIAVDTSGAALQAVVADARPDLIKPNDDELAELAGVELPDEPATDAVLSLARSFVPSGTGAALVTLGSAGALLVQQDGAWVARPPRIRVASTVGAGDSSLAGYLLAAVADEPPAARLERAVRYGAAAASLPGTQAPRPADLPSGPVPLTVLA